MLALNSKVKKRHISIVIIWLSFTILAFAYFAKARLVNFDVDKKLHGIDHLQLATYLQDFRATDSLGSGYRVIHFSQSNCDCQKVSQKHILELNKMAEDNQFSVVNVVVNKHEVIPATPSVAILGASGDVIYFGPYGQGLGCSQTSGFAQTMLNNLLKGFTANIIVDQAKGCYCHLG